MLVGCDPHSRGGGEVTIDLFTATGGVHTSALRAGQKIVLPRKAIGRGNAITKISGECSFQQIPTEDALIGELRDAHRGARHRVSVIISRSARADVAVDLGEKQQVTLIGFVRDSRMTVHATRKRVIQTVEPTTRA